MVICNYSKNKSALFLQEMTIESMSRYVSPVNPAIYPHLALTLLSIGLFFTAWFFVYPFKFQFIIF